MTRMKRTLLYASLLAVAVVLAIPSAASATTGTGSPFDPYRLSCGASVVAQPNPPYGPSGSNSVSWYLHTATDVVYYQYGSTGNVHYQNPQHLFGGGTMYDLASTSGPIPVGALVGTYFAAATDGDPAAVKADHGVPVRVIRWC